MAKMTQEEKENFDELYQYVKKEIFEYTDQSLPKYMILRLKGLAEGKFMANNNIKSISKYDYRHILYTFKINKMRIKEIVKSSNFKNEQHRFNTIMLIIEKEINDVVNRLKQKVKSEEKIEKIDLRNMTNEGAEYTNKTKDRKTLEELEELW